MKKEQILILQEFADKVRTAYPKAQIWAFGSFARGSETVESDLDICVVLPDMESDDRLAVSDLAWEVGFGHDLHISTVVFSSKDFEKGPISASPLMNTIRSEGIAA